MWYLFLCVGFIVLHFVAIRLKWYCVLSLRYRTVEFIYICVNFVVLYLIAERANGTVYWHNGTKQETDSDKHPLIY